MVVNLKRIERCFNLFRIDTGVIVRPAGSSLRNNRDATIWSVTVDRVFAMLVDTLGTRWMHDVLETARMKGSVTTLDWTA